MLFNSLPFLFGFMPLSIAGFQIAGYFGRRAVLVWLCLASLLFYAAWNPRFLIFLLASVCINYCLSLWIARSQVDSPTRKSVLYLGVAFNLGALFYYKYLFHLLTVLAATGLGRHVGLSDPHPIVLPLGISFFTFTQIGYLIDLAQDQAEEQDLLSYLLFVTFFPHLIAGPLLHHREIMPQFDDSQAARGKDRKFQIHSANLATGLTLFIFGLSKKVLVADKLAPAADAAFSKVAAHGLLNAWSGILIYCMQLYFDFSGYSDMAIGLARIFGIRFPWNFDSPWKATNIADYWKRWHMTLTRYVTLYLYNPLLLAIQRRRIAVGKKNSRRTLRTVEGFFQLSFVPLMVTMLLTGIWHGAGLQFVVFGALHGLYLSAHQAWKHFLPSAAADVQAVPDSQSKLLFKRLGVLLQVAVALVFFRAESFQQACRFAGSMIGLHGHGSLISPISFALAAALLPVVWFLPNTQQILGEEPIEDADTTHLGLRWQPTAVWAVGTALVFFASLVSLNGASSFLYFQF